MFVFKKWCSNQIMPNLALRWTLFVTILLTCHNETFGLEIERRFKVSEDTPPNTSIGFLDNSGNGASGIGPPTSIQSSFYIIYPDESGVEDYFSVDNLSGEIRLRRPLDYETKRQFVFIAIGSGTAPPMRVVIEVTDVNDNPPIFPTQLEVLEISEIAKIGSEIAIPPAMDADSPEFGIQRYAIVSGNTNNAFRLSTRSINERLYVDLAVNTPLDREYMDVYDIVVAASDGGSPAKTATMTLQVRVADANDNAPAWEKSKYSAQLAVDAQPGAQVLAVRATDDDAGDNSAVHYLLLPSPQNAQQYFSIEPETGEIHLTRSLSDSNGVGGVLGSKNRLQLLVMARDRGLQPLESTVFVTISMVGGASGSVSLSVIYLTPGSVPAIAEDSKPGSLIARISVLDATTGSEIKDAHLRLLNNGPTYGGQHSQQHGTSVMSVKRTAEHHGTFVLYTVGTLDRERLANYSIRLEGSRQGQEYSGSGGIEVAARNLTIMILDVNDNTPVFSQAVYEASIQELASSGTSIIQVTATDPDTGDNARVTYSIKPRPYLHNAMPTPNPIDTWFLIDPDTGLVMANQHVDCEVNPNPVIIVVAQDNPMPPWKPKIAEAEVRLTVLDVNDNPPIFNQTDYNISLKEDTDVGTCFMRVNASDPDCGRNAQLQFRFPDPSYGSEREELEKTFKLGRDGILCLARALDYEARPAYRFSIEAVDGGGLSSSALVQVLVEDVNDNGPVFYPASYNVSLRVDSKPRRILIVSAEDPDTGAGGEVTYGLASGNEWGLFRLDSNTGEIFLEHSLLRGGATAYFLKITATDGAGLSTLAPAMVTISVLSDDYPAPVFEQSRYQFKVREDTLPGIAVGSVKASGNGMVVYSLYAGDPKGFFSIEHRTGSILVNKYLDHDTQESILLNVQAAVGDPPAYNHTQVQIRIEDVNDNAPRFDAHKISVAVYEDTALGSPIFTVAASDKDSGRNGDLTYRLAQNPGAMFKIHPQSGEISLAAQLDFEAVKSYEVIVIAEDGGRPSMSGNVTLNVSVLDSNDNTPIFDQPYYSATVSEDTALATVIFTVHATDLDTGKNAQIFYSLPDAGVGGAHFGIYPNSGQVFIRNRLDREVASEHSVKIVASDGRHSAKASLSIVVADVNDNSPNCSVSASARRQGIVSASSMGGIYRIEENMPANSIVGQLDAFDPDLGANGTVFYAMEETSSLFKVDPTTGIIYALQTLNHEARRSYTLALRASDGGQPANSADCPIKIEVTDVNDNPPFFTLPHSSRIPLQEEMPAGSEVTQVRASDPDAGQNGTVRYSFLGENTLPFAVDAESGVITTTKILDYETDPRMFELNIIAQDEGTPPQKSVKKLSVQITDVEDGGLLLDGLRGPNGRPRDGVALVTFEVSESTPIGSKIGIIDPNLGSSSHEAYLNSGPSNNGQDESDGGSNKNLDVAYEIVSGNRLGLFEIDRLSAQLYLVRPLDYESFSLLFLKIKKVNGSNGARAASAAGVASYPDSSIIHAKIYVKDENDNAPTFAEDPIVFSVPENVGIGQVIWTYNATDRDTGSNGRVKYAIDKQLPQDVFNLDAVSGEMWVSKNLDYEAFSEYMIVVTATDQAVDKTKRKVTKVTSRIYITDVNDNSPMFVSPSNLIVLEDEPLGIPVFHVVARDSDWRDNARVAYSIVKGNDAGYFRLNKTSGGLSFVRHISRGASRTFHLTIQASDHGSPSRHATQTLDVLVEDVSNNAPRFLRSVYYANVSEDAPTGTRVIQLKASKPDDGESNTKIIYVFPQSADTSSKFKLNQRTGEVETIQPLDREVQEEFIITVYAKEPAFPARYDAATLIIRVIDVNDHAPRLTRASCIPATVPEASHFVNIRRILAVDGDSGNNAKITYSIAGGNIDGKFYIDPSSGYLSTESLDREAVPFYNLTLVALDSGVPGRTDTCELAINVSDVNDNPPSFDRATYSASLPEDVPVGTRVLTVRATDPDLGSAGSVAYSIRNDSSGLFEVNNVSGQIQTKRPINFELLQSHSFSVVAHDNGPSVTHASATMVTISVTDVNDNAPQFEEWLIVANVTGELTAGQRIVKVVATDADGPSQNSEIHYSFVEPRPAQFNINPQTGVISAKSSITLAADNRVPIMFRVRASDAGSPAPLTSIAMVYIRIAPLNEGYGNLHFAEQFVTAFINEAAKDGEVVAKLRTVGAATRNIEYSIVAGSNVDAFRIDPNAGIITVYNRTLLDADIVTGDVRSVPGQSKSRGPKHTLVVMARSATAEFSFSPGVAPVLDAFATVEITVTDANDNAPEFLQSSYFTSVYEGKPKGTFVMQISALDMDQDANAALSYSIVGGNFDGAFRIERDGLLRTAGQLDREITSEYTLSIMAADNGRPDILSGTATVGVRVLDSNDNVPAFPQLSEISLNENTPVGTVLTEVTAKDVDSGPTLMYRIVENGDVTEPFSIDKFSGRVMLAEPLNYESRKEHSLQILVSDGSHETSTQLNVIVEDDNDNTPEFTQHFYQVSVPEDTPPGTSVARVTATDEDTGVNGAVTYRITRVNPSMSGFTINRTTGDLYLSESRGNFAKNGTHVVGLAIEAVDGGSPERKTTTSVQVQIVPNTNQQQPLFEKGTYEFEVKEDLVVHSIIGPLPTVKRGNRHIIFSIVAGDLNRSFSIDHAGNVILEKPLDRETVASYSLTASVATRTNSVANSTALVTIRLLDVNDHTPAFSSPRYSALLSESAPVGSSVLSVAATDKDIGDNGRIRYAITSGNDGDSFAIDQVTGVISVHAPLDFEDRQAGSIIGDHPGPTFKLVVRASDDGDIPRSSLTAVHISITDANDHEPVFTSAIYKVRVPESTPNGSVLFTATATDRDTGNISYSILEYRTMALIRQTFAINPHSGAVRTIGAFDFETTTAYSFTIVATDSGGKSSDIPAQVIVSGVDEFAPEFSIRHYVFRASYASDAGDVVGVVYADDKDAGFDGQVRYRLSNPSIYFEIHETTGVITVASSLSPLAQEYPIGASSPGQRISQRSALPSTKRQHRVRRHLGHHRSSRLTQLGNSTISPMVGRTPPHAVSKASPSTTPSTSNQVASTMSSAYERSLAMAASFIQSIITRHPDDPCEIDETTLAKAKKPLSGSRHYRALSGHSTRNNDATGHQFTKASHPKRSVSPEALSSGDADDSNRGLLIRKVFLTVIAQSGPIDSPKPAETSVEIQLSHDPVGGFNAVRAADLKIAIIATVCVVLFALILLLICCICWRLQLCACCGFGSRKRKKRQQQQLQQHHQLRDSSRQKCLTTTGLVSIPTSTNGASQLTPVPRTSFYHQRDLTAESMKRNSNSPFLGTTCRETNNNQTTTPSILNGFRRQGPSPTKDEIVSPVGSPGERVPLAIAADHHPSSAEPRRPFGSRQGLDSGRIGGGLTSFSGTTTHGGALTVAYGERSSSGRGSELGDNMSDIWQQQQQAEYQVTTETMVEYQPMSGNRGPVSNGRIRSAPDSGINMLMPEDCASIAGSEALLPSAKDYLQSLGVDEGPGSHLDPSPQPSFPKTPASATFSTGTTATAVSQQHRPYAVLDPRDGMDAEDEEDIDLQNMIYSKLSEISDASEIGSAHRISGGGPTMPRSAYAARGKSVFEFPPSTSNGTLPLTSNATRSHPSQNQRTQRGAITPGYTSSGVVKPYPPPAYNATPDRPTNGSIGIATGRGSQFGTDAVPSYQPLSHVFSEIVRLKDSHDTLKREKRRQSPGKNRSRNGPESDSDMSLKPSNNVTNDKNNNYSNNNNYNNTHLPNGHDNNHLSLPNGGLTNKAYSSSTNSNGSEDGSVCLGQPNLGLPHSRAYSPNLHNLPNSAIAGRNPYSPNGTTKCHVAFQFGPGGALSQRHPKSHFPASPCPDVGSPGPLMPNYASPDSSSTPPLNPNGPVLKMKHKSPSAKSACHTPVSSAINYQESDVEIKI